MLTKCDWPPPFTERISQRAKRIQLRLHKRFGLELIIPAHRKRYDCLTILQEHRPWIEKHWPSFAHQHSHADDTSFPLQIEINALKKIISIHTIKTQARSLELIEAPDSKLTLIGNIENITQMRKLLIGWFKNLAADYLKKRALELSQKHSLPFSSLKVRQQKNRWGTCNTLKNISLNYKLIFLPTELIDSVIVHELAHLKHLNHSPNFWAFLATLDHDYLSHKKQLRKAESYILQNFFN